MIENFFGRDDDPGTPMNAACGQSATMHTDDAACGTLDELCGMIRKDDERIDGFGHKQALRYGAWPGYGIVAWSLLLARWLGRRFSGTAIWRQCVRKARRDIIE